MPANTPRKTGAAIQQSTNVLVNTMMNVISYLLSVSPVWPLKIDRDGRCGCKPAALVRHSVLVPLTVGPSSATVAPRLEPGSSLSLQPASTARCADRRSPGQD